MIIPAVKSDRLNEVQLRSAEELRDRIVRRGIGKTNRRSEEQVRRVKKLCDRVDQLKADRPSGPVRKPTVYTEEIGERIVDYLLDLKSIRWIGDRADMPPARNLSVGC